MSTIIWFIISFLSGSLPFSLWLGRLAGKDIRQYGDGNPGATNTWKAAGPFLGMAAVVLDFSKGAIPILLVNFVLNLEGWSLAVVALAPILGHAFSPFLRFRGGKALAVTFGVWCGLSLWLAPTALGISFALWLFILKKDGRAVLAGMLSLLILLLIIRADTAWLLIWLGNTAILAWKTRFPNLHLPDN
ncbi:MAG: glycerol-3-phosphate acyltransferase [Candidatus Promineifilaceae bacterium]